MLYFCKMPFFSISSHDFTSSYGNTTIVHFSFGIIEKTYSVHKYAISFTTDDGVIIWVYDNVADRDAEYLSVVNTIATILTYPHTHTNMAILNLVTEAFTTALKTAYDATVTWISTNGANLINHLSNTSNPHGVTKAQVGLGNVDNTGDANKPISIATQTALDGKVDENAPITGATKTKVTYDSKGLVTGGVDATTADIPDSASYRYVTDAQIAAWNALIGGSIFQSVWNANTNMPALTSGVGTKGFYYIVDTLGATNLDGITDWKVGDWVIFDGTVWRKVDNTDAVSSVNGLTGSVLLDSSNVPDTTNKRYITDAQLVVLGNTSGTNSGDNAVNSLYSGLVSNATHTGDVAGATTLAIQDSAITGKSLQTLDGDEEFLIYHTGTASLAKTTLNDIKAFGGWTYVILEAQFSTADGTADVDVTDFFFTPEPNKRYEVEGRFFLESSATTTGVRVGVNWPNDGIVQNAGWLIASNSATAFASRFWGGTGTGNAASTGVQTTGSGIFSQFNGLLVTDGDVTDNFYITLRSEINGSTVYINENSFIRYREY